MTTLQEALDKCERVAIESGAHESYKAVGEAFSELRSALAQQGQEPVAYMDNDGNISDNNDHGTFNTPLYAAPAPQAQPVATKEPVKLYAGPPDVPPTEKRFFDGNGTEYTLMNGCISNCNFVGFEKMVAAGLQIEINDEPMNAEGIISARVEVVEIEPAPQIRWEDTTYIAEMLTFDTPNGLSKEEFEALHPVKGGTPRAEILQLAESCGAKITGKLDGSEPIAIVFTVDAWRAFDAAMAQLG